MLPDVVKNVVREILPHFYKTFNSEKCKDYQINGEVCNILCNRTDLVFQLPNQAPYQLGHTRVPGYYTGRGRKLQPKLLGIF